MVFKKGDPKPPTSGMKKGQKIRATLNREERRKIFDERVSQVWEGIIDELRPEYIADQYLGKPVERYEHTIKTGPSEEDIKLAKQLEELERDNG